MTTSIWVALKDTEISKDIVDNYRSLFELKISVGTIEKLQKQKPRGNLMPKLSSWSFDMEGHAKKCKHNTSNDPFSRCKKCAIIGYRKELTITEYGLTTSTHVNYKIQKERNLYLVLRLRGDTEHDTNDNVTTKTQNTFNTAHMNTET